MEDEARPLPQGWVRSYDPENSHQFFVDTTKEPPRSIWHHPYDDEEYVNSLSGAERERVEQESINYKRDHPPTKEDYIHAPSDDDDDDFLPAHYQNQTAAAGSAASGSNAQLPPRPDGKGGKDGKDGKDGKGKEKISFGRKMKDKVTGMSHEEREQQRREREEQERRAYEQHVKIRNAMRKAAQTGEAQLIGKDKDGKNIYIEPPRTASYAGGYPGVGYGYSPYTPYNSNGIYSTPNARYVRPGMPYARPYGSPYGYGGYGGGYGGYGYNRGGYGGGMGMPVMGGLLGGALLGGLLF